MTADTLKRLARAGKLVVYRPGKQHLSTLLNVWEMVQAKRVGRAPPSTKKRPPMVPNALGLTESELSHMALEHALNELRNKVTEREREDAWERKYEARKAARQKAGPPRKSKKP